jgi:hypothetical protein
MPPTFWAHTTSALVPLDAMGARVVGWTGVPKGAAT